MEKEKCPKCSSEKVVAILYGKPAATAMESAKRGEIVLGGCCIEKNAPHRHCKNCKNEW
ncbi:hypothetical protein J4450_01165 [Candidatus Micrarchaeota archaeon]|nr:hypothetical protein [Candidatus Micrarchaeota archaeon]